MYVLPSRIPDVNPTVPAVNHIPERVAMQTASTGETWNPPPGADGNMGPHIPALRAATVSPAAVLASIIPPPNVLAACETGNERHSYTRVLSNLSLPLVPQTTGPVHAVSNMRAETRKDWLYKPANLARIRHVTSFGHGDPRGWEELEPEEVVTAIGHILDEFDDWDAGDATEGLRRALAQR
jgi:hypothetical protein